MGFINQTHFQYYTPGQKFTATGGQTVFTLTLDPKPAGESNFVVFVKFCGFDEF